MLSIAKIGRDRSEPGAVTRRKAFEFRSRGLDDIFLFDKCKKHQGENICVNKCCF